MTEMNRAAGLLAKDAGQMRATDNADGWRDAVLVELREWLQRRKEAGEHTMTMEQFRATAAAQPPSHQCWGALPRIAAALKLIEAAVHVDGSPVVRAAESVRTHAHHIRVWRIL